jgi:hypothetical protein
MNWSETNIDTIIGGIAPDGVSYKKMFLSDYAKEFNQQNLGTCNNCIADYHTKWKIRMSTNSNTSNYRLKEKYNGIQLGIGSNIFLNNSNITDELAKELIKNRGSHFFDRMPEPIVEQTDAPKPKRTRTKKQ